MILIFLMLLGSCCMSDGINDSSVSRMAVELGVRSEGLEVRREQVTLIWLVVDGVLWIVMLGMCGSDG